MVQVNYNHLLYKFDGGFIKIPTDEIRAAQIFTFESKFYLLIRTNCSTAPKAVTNAPQCPIMDFLVANGYQYCIPVDDFASGEQILNQILS